MNSKIGNIKSLVSWGPASAAYIPLAEHWHWSSTVYQPSQALLSGLPCKAFMVLIKFILLINIIYKCPWLKCDKYFITILISWYVTEMGDIDGLWSSIITLSSYSLYRKMPVLWGFGALFRLNVYFHSFYQFGVCHGIAEVRSRRLLPSWDGIQVVYTAEYGCILKGAQTYTTCPVGDQTLESETLMLEWGNVIDTQCFYTVNHD